MKAIVRTSVREYQCQQLFSPCLTSYIYKVSIYDCNSLATEDGSTYCRNISCLKCVVLFLRISMHNILGYQSYHGLGSNPIYFFKVII